MAVVAIAASLLAACTPAQPLVDGPARPALWVISDADTRVVILGSVHQLPPDLDWEGGLLAAEIDDAQELILELAPDELAKAPALFSATSADEPVPSLDTRFGTTRGERVREYARDAGLDTDDAERTESWALALAIGRVIAADAGLSSDNGVETRLTSAFATTRRPISGLETTVAQLAMFDTLPQAAQDSMVAAALRNAPQSLARTRHLLTAWARGDEPALATAAAEAMADTPALVEPVIHARNRAWAEALTARMARPGRVMVAVGAGHLVGDGSLIAELRGRGIAVRRLQ